SRSDQEETRQGSNLPGFKNNGTGGDSSNENNTETSRHLQGHKTCLMFAF
ncbi:hypothetical protein UFOVP589_1, partial [uncultured Caudovirales phage]